MARPKIAAESRRVAVSITVAHDTLDLWRLLATRKNVSLGQLVDGWVALEPPVSTFSVHQIVGANTSRPAKEPKSEG